MAAEWSARYNPRYVATPSWRGFALTISAAFHSLNLATYVMCLMLTVPTIKNAFVKSGVMHLRT